MSDEDGNTPVFIPVMNISMSSDIPIPMLFL